MIAGPFGKRRDRVRIDTSLAIVNIVLLLLFFFLIVGQTPQPAADMRLSETRDLPLNQLPRPILIVRAEDDWQLDGQPVSPELLPAAMAGRDRLLHLMIDREAPAELLVGTLSAPVLAGYDLRLVTLGAQGAP